MTHLQAHAVRHAGLLGAAILLAWVASTNLTQGGAVMHTAALVIAAVAGITFTTLIHEWCHLGGAKLARAHYTIPGKFGLFVFDYDFNTNTLPQFNLMSWAGQLGSWMTVIALASVLDLTQPVQAMIVSGGLASAVFGGAIEWPVLRRSQTSGNPFGELSKINTGVLLRALFLSLFCGGVCWWLLT